MITRNPITSQGKKILEHKLQWLRQEQEKAIDEITEARKKGDLSENFEYHAAKRRNGELGGAIASLDQYLCSTISPRLPSSISIGCFGARVTILNLQSNEKVSYVIVGDREAAAEKGSISVSSGLAQKLLGQSVGTRFILNDKEYKITEIRTATEHEIESSILDDDWVK